MSNYESKLDSQPLKAIPQVVYYPGLWYSTEKLLVLGFSQEKQRNARLLRIQFDLKLLSIFFPQIYIARTHLLTHYSPQYQLLVKELLATETFKYLSETGRIVTSSRPGLDGESDTERIAERISKINWLSPPAPETRLNLPKIASITVDSLKESTENIPSFASFRAPLHQRSSAAAEKYDRLLSLCENDDAPFFHEAFIEHLFPTLSEHQDHAESIWRASNSNYLLSGLPGHDDVIPYFSPDFESDDFRFLGTDEKLDRYLYNPDVLLTFLAIFISGKSLSNFVSIDAHKVWHILEEIEAETGIQEFRASFFKMIRDLSQRLFTLSFLGKLGSTDPLREMLNYLDRPRNSSVAENLIEVAKEAKDIGKALEFESLSITAAALNVAREKFGSATNTLIRKMRYPDLVRVPRHLHKKLKN